MLPWVYMMIGFTLCHKVCVSMPIHVTEWQYTRPHLIMCFGFWGLLPGFILRLGRRVYIFMMHSMSCSYVGLHWLSASSILGSGGLYLLLWIWQWIFAPVGHVHCGFALIFITWWASLMLIGFMLSCRTRFSTYPPVQQIKMAVTFMVCSYLSVKYCTQCITCTVVLPSGA